MLRAWRHRVRRHRLAGSRGGAGQASCPGRQGWSRRRIRCSVDGVAGLTAYFGLLHVRQAEGRRDRRGLGGGRLGRIDRRARSPRSRVAVPPGHRRRQGQAAHWPTCEARLRRRGRLQGRRHRQGAAVSGAEAGSMPAPTIVGGDILEARIVADEQPRPHRLPRRDLADTTACRRRPARAARPA